MDLHTLWYFIIGLVLAAYVITDGYDLGIGILALFTPKDNLEHRQRLIRIIGPHWDGNEVWLIVFGGMLFAVFPRVYAALLSGFYLPFIVLLFAFIFRGIAIPLRDRHNNAKWLRFWDLSFGLSSFAIVFLLGCVAAALLRGIPLNKSGIMKAGLWDLIGPFALLVGVLAVVLLTMHGAIYAVQRSRGDLRSYCRKAAVVTWLLTLILAVATAFIVLASGPARILREHWALSLGLVAFLAGSIIYIPRGLKSGRLKKTFLASSVVVGGFIALFHLYSYPTLLRSTEPAQNLTIYNAASSKQAMMTTLILTAIAMPIVIAYTLSTHRAMSRPESDYS